MGQQLLHVKHLTFKGSFGFYHEPQGSTSFASTWMLSTQTSGPCLDRARVSHHTPSFELSWGTMPVKRGLSKVLSTPNSSFSSGNPHNPVLANPLSFGNSQAGSQWLSCTGRALCWSCFGASLGPAAFDPDVFPIPAYWILAKSATSSLKQTRPLCGPWLVWNSDVVLLNSAGHAEHGQDWGEHTWSWRTHWENAFPHQPSSLEQDDLQSFSNPSYPVTSTMFRAQEQKDPIFKT